MVEAKLIGISLGFIVAVIGLNMGLFLIGISLNQVSEGEGVLFSEKGSLFSEMIDLFDKKLGPISLKVEDSGDDDGNGGGGGGNGGGSNGGGRSSLDKEIVEENLIEEADENIDVEIPKKATCNDKIKNQEEDDVDCGGPCSPCYEKPLKNFEYLKYGGYGIIGGGVVLLLIFYFNRRKKNKILKQYKSKWGRVLKRRLSI